MVDTFSLKSGTDTSGEGLFISRKLMRKQFHMKNSVAMIDYAFLTKYWQDVVNMFVNKLVCSKLHYVEL